MVPISRSFQGRIIMYGWPLVFFQPEKQKYCSMICFANGIERGVPDIPLPIIISGLSKGSSERNRCCLAQIRRESLLFRCLGQISIYCGTPIEWEVSTIFCTHAFLLKVLVWHRQAGHPITPQIQRFFGFYIALWASVWGNLLSPRDLCIAFNLAWSFARPFDWNSSSTTMHVPLHAVPVIQRAPRARSHRSLWLDPFSSSKQCQYPLVIQHNHGKSPCLIGKSMEIHYKWQFSIANCQITEW